MGSSVGAVTSYTFTNVQADHAITARFAINTLHDRGQRGARRRDRPERGGGGELRRGPGVHDRAGARYHVDSLLVDGGSVGAVTSYTFTNVTADHTIHATFAIDTYTIMASAGAARRRSTRAVRWR